MPLQRTDLVLRPSKYISQTDSDGGIMDSSKSIPNNVIRNLVNNISNADRTNGALLHYKVFVHNASPSNNILSECCFSLFQSINDLKVLVLLV